jgi:DNA-binding transcriptional ArsR family regulator
MIGAARQGAPDGRPPRLKPGTPSLLRELNDRAALELLLAEGPLTRAQLSDRTGVSKVTVSQMLARLEERRLVMVAGEQAGGRGPNAAPFPPALTWLDYMWNLTRSVPQ